VIESLKGAGAPLDAGTIYDGGNSAFQALGLACLAGAARVIFLGLDMGKTGGRAHYFGEHPKTLNRNSPFDVFRANFNQAAPEFEAREVDVVNCSRSTTLTGYRRAALIDELGPKWNTTEKS